MKRDIRIYDNPPSAENMDEHYRIMDDVEMGGWCIGEDTLSTCGAASCIVLAVHNQATKKGMIGHFSDIGEVSGKFSNREQFLEAIDAIEQLGPEQHNSIWIGGGAPFEENGTDSVAVDRQFAEVEVRKYLEMHETPINQTKVQWSDEGRVIDVKLDCSSGMLEVDSYPDLSPGLLLDGLIAARDAGFLNSSDGSA